MARYLLPPVFMFAALPNGRKLEGHPPTVAVMPIRLFKRGIGPFVQGLASLMGADDELDEGRIAPGGLVGG